MSIPYVSHVAVYRVVSTREREREREMCANRCEFRHDGRKAVGRPAATKRHHHHQTPAAKNKMDRVELFD